MNSLYSFNSVKYLPIWTSQSKLSCSDSSGNAAVFDGSTVALMDLGSDIEQTEAELRSINLVGHRKAVQCSCWCVINDRSSLITADSNYIILWDTVEIKIRNHNGDAIRGHVIKESPASTVSSLAVNPSDEILAQVSGNIVYLTNIENKLEVHNLEHRADVTEIQFTPQYDFTLITLTAERCFLVWNCESGDLLYQSSIISSYNLTHITINNYIPEFYITSGDGVIRSYSIDEHDAFKQLREFTIDGEILTIRTYSVESGDNSQLPTDELDSADTEYNALLAGFNIMIIITTTELIIINIRTIQRIATIQFTETPISDGVLSSYPGSLSDDNSRIYYYLNSYNHRLYKCYMNILDICLQYYSTDQSISVIASTPILKNSPLKSDLIFKPASKPTTRKKVRPKPGDNQPIIVHKKIKSSGYNATRPGRKMFQPLVKSSKLTRPSAQKQVETIKQPYPVDSLPASKIILSTAADARPTHVRYLSHSPCGRHIAVGCGNGVTLLMKSKPGTKELSALSGHSNSVNTVQWSRNSSYLLTSSADCSAQLWVRGQTVSALDLNFIDGNLNSTNQKFVCDVTHAQFYFMDKFILLTSADHLYLYKYYIDLTKDDTKRYKNNSRYKLVTKLQIQEAQNITSLSAVNDFYSYICITTCSDKSIQIFDLNRQALLSKIQDSHTRPAHSVKLQQSNSGTQLPISSYDSFITSSVNDGVKLWDLRTLSCVRIFDQHRNRIHSCYSELSPCSRYIYSTSEDKSLYVYEVGTGKVVNKITGFKDSTCSLSCHPTQPQIIAGCLDGSIHWCD